MQVAKAYVIQTYFVFCCILLELQHVNKIEVEIISCLFTNKSDCSCESCISQWFKFTHERIIFSYAPTNLIVVVKATFHSGLSLPMQFETQNHNFLFTNKSQKKIHFAIATIKHLAICLHLVSHNFLNHTLLEWKLHQL